MYDEHCIISDVNLQVNGEQSDSEIFDDLSKTIEEILQKKNSSDVTSNLVVPVLVSFEFNWSFPWNSLLSTCWSVHACIWAYEQT